MALWRGTIVGYCYEFYRPRPAYRYTLEESIYVESGMGGRGIGSACSMQLIAKCEQGPWRQMLAIIGDGHNNAGSLAIHKKFGFTVAGQLRSVGYKMGDWWGYVNYAAPARRGRLNHTGIKSPARVRESGERH